MRLIRNIRFSMGTVMMFVLTAAAAMALFSKIQHLTDVVTRPGVTPPGWKIDVPSLFLLAIVLTAVALGSWKEHTAVWSRPPTVTSIMLRNAKKTASHVFFHHSRRGPRGSVSLTYRRASMGIVTETANAPWHQYRIARSCLASAIQINVRQPTQASVTCSMTCAAECPFQAPSATAVRTMASRKRLGTSNFHPAGRGPECTWTRSNSAVAAAAVRTNIMIDPIENRIFRSSPI